MDLVSLSSIDDFMTDSFENLWKMWNSLWQGFTYVLTCIGLNCFLKKLFWLHTGSKDD